MNLFSLRVRQILARLCIATCTLVLFPMNVHAAGNATLELRPHCDSESPLDCAGFEVRDPETLQTPEYKTGDVIDMDLVVSNKDREAVQRFRAWIAYDPSVLEGMDVTVDPAFPVPTPGENVFDAAEGYIKISGTASAAAGEELIVLARLRMRVLQPASASSPLVFFDASGTPESRSGIFTMNNNQEENIMAENPISLFVRFQNSGSASSAASTEAASSTSAAAVSSMAVASTATSQPTSSVFTMLQVQGVRITTEGSSVFLAWDMLPSTELVGYNIYYGTTTGRYIQRRSVDEAANSITIRALPLNTTYYYAIRGVNASGQETEFSQEVGVSVGNPRTSTAPLTANTRPTQTPGTDGTVAGNTGISSALLVFLTLSAVAGTLIAFRRQWAAARA